jgi:carbon-monoxide dehydrogenase medium subunit
MMSLWKQYFLPNTLEEALQLLNQVPGQARVIAGGTDLLLDLQQGRRPPAEALVDVTEIPELKGIHTREEAIYLGAGTTYREILDSDLLKIHAQCLLQASEKIGGPQVRNVATIGGNVAHALPAGDGSIALIALGSEAQIASQDGSRWEPLEDLFEAPAKPAFDPCREILVQFRFPRKKVGESSAFMRVMRPQGVAIAILNMAIWMRQSDTGTLEEVRLAIGPAGPKPFRATQTEQVMRDKRWSGEVFHEALSVLEGEVQLRTSPHRATKQYRRHLLGEIFRRLVDSQIRR